MKLIARDDPLSSGERAPSATDIFIHDRFKNPKTAIKSNGLMNLYEGV